MSSGLFRIGNWCFRHRRWVLCAWAVVIVVLAVVAINVKQPTSNAFSIPGTESQQALNLLDQKFPGTGGAQAQVVFSVASPGTLTGSADRQAIEATVAELKKLPQVVGVTDPFQTGTVSKDGRIAYAVVAYPVPVANVTSQAQSALLASGGPAKAAGIAVNFGGQVAQAQTKTDTELVGILIAFLVLLIGFGSVIAGLLPLYLGPGRGGGDQPGAPGAHVGDQRVEYDIGSCHHDRPCRRDRLFAVRAQPAPPATGGGNGGRPVHRKGGGDIGIGRVLCGNHSAHCPCCPQHRQHPVPHGHGAGGGGRSCRRSPGGHHADPGNVGVCRRAAHQQPLGPSQNRQDGGRGVRAVVEALCHHHQAGADSGGAGRHHRSPGGGNAVPSHAAGSA